MTSVILFAVLLWLHTAIVGAFFTPASPSNSTDASGLNLTETSQITMQWYSHGSYANHIATASRRQSSTGISKGVLVHLSPDNLSPTTDPTNAPWIAFVSCDGDLGTSSDTDVFTLAQSKGAVSAVLYSLYSSTCVLSPDFQASHWASSTGIDIFVTLSSGAANVVNYQFGQLEPPTIIEYQSEVLNSSFDDITKSIKEEYPVSAGYLLTTLEAWNATEDAFTDGGSQGGSGGGETNSTDSGNGNQGSGALGGRLGISSSGLTLGFLFLASVLIHYS